MQSPITRRNLLVRGAALGLGLVTARWTAAGQTARPTPAQPKGPFYAVSEPPDSDVDLTRVRGRAGIALGEPIAVAGVVRDARGAVLPEAWVEIWQACASGRYNHPGDRNPAPLDPDFQYWGRARTDARGAYRFLTVKPGPYPNGPGWMRPPHIHFRVVARALPSLTTQMYFEDEPLNESDRILRSLRREDRRRLTVPFENAPEGAREGRFDVVLGWPGEAGATPGTP